MLEIKNVSKSYGKKEVLKDINLTLPGGEIIGFFGENGAGKTTLLKSILGLTSFHGEILVDGEKVSRDNIEKFSFATCEHSFFPNLTADAHREFYKNYFEKFSDKRFDSLMKFFDLPHKKVLKHMSVGQQNQFEVILALSQGADYILMDEPFAGNDVFNREDFYKVLLGILEDHETIFIATHLIEEVSDVISRAILIHRGEIVGDADVLELEENGMSLMDYVKSTYGYRKDRVSQALSELTGEE